MEDLRAKVKKRPNKPTRVSVSIGTVPTTSKNPKEGDLGRKGQEYFFLSLYFQYFQKRQTKSNVTEDTHCAPKNTKEIHTYAIM